MALTGGVPPKLNYGFAFGSQRYSDRTLLLEIVAVGGSSRSGSSGGSVRESPQLDGSSTLNQEESPDAISTELSPNSTPRRKRPRVDDPTAQEEGEEKAAEEKEGAGTPVLRVERLQVSAVILAAQSPFFRTLFDDGTFKEAAQREVKLRINSEEVDALKDLVYFMYFSMLKTNDPVKVITVLSLADRYQACAAAQHCIEVLQGIPMTTAIALMYLDHPVSKDLVNLFKPVKLSAFSFFSQRFRDVVKSNDELMTLPLSAIRAVFISSKIILPSEDYIFQFFTKWVLAHYEDPVQRRSVFNNALVPLVRLVHLSSWQLRDLLRCDLLDLSKYTVAIVFALLFKSDAAFAQIPELKVRNWIFAPRCYVMKPLKVTHFEQPIFQSICYLDLKHEDCISMYPDNKISSEAFTIRKNRMMVRAGCIQLEGTGHGLGVYVAILNYARPVMIRAMVSARRTPGFFQNDVRIQDTFNNGDDLVGVENLIPWTQLMANDSPWFINGTLHLRVEVTLMAQPEP